MSFRPGSVTTRPLTMADREACIAVENAAFANPDHRASPEKFSYRLTVCPELCMGVFVRDAAAQAHGPPSPDTLVGHIIATRCAGPVITDSDMGVPPNWRDAMMTAAPGAASSAAASPPIGHQPAGTSVGVHSLGIVPSAQGKGLGTLLMRAYLERMGQVAAAAAASPSSGAHSRVDRVALICQDYLVEYYKKLGYTNNGPSAAQFGGGGWYDMVYDIPKSS